MTEEATSPTLDSAAPAEAPATAGQPAEQPQAASETSTTNAPELTQAQEEKLYAGKYKSPEELEKGYSESQKEAKRLAEEANLLKEISDASGMTPEQIRAELNAVKAEKMQKEGLDPEKEAMKQELAVIKATQKKQEFFNEYNQLIANNPEAEKVRGALEELYMNRTNESVGEIFQSNFSALVQTVKDQSVQKLEAKEASNTQSSQGSGPVVSDQEKELISRAQQSGKTSDVQAAMKSRLFGKK